MQKYIILEKTKVKLVIELIIVIKNKITRIYTDYNILKRIKKYNDIKFKRKEKIIIK